MLWTDINKKIPSLWSLRTQWFFSFLPFVSAPPVYHWEMRTFLNNTPFKPLDIFPVDQLGALVKIFKSHPQFAAEHLELIQKLSLTQISLITPAILETLLIQFSPNSNNLLLLTILNQLSDLQKQSYFDYVNTHVRQQLLPPKDAPILYILPPPRITQASVNKLNWCVRFFSNAIFTIRKSIVKMLYDIPAEESKEIANNLIESNEVEEFFPDRAFEHLWKQPILKKINTFLITNTASNEKDLTAYLKILEVDEQIQVLKNALKGSEEKIGLKPIESFLNCYDDKGKKQILNVLLKDLSPGECEKKIIHALLAGKISIFKTTRFGLLASYYYADNPYISLPEKFIENTLTTLKDDLSAPLFELPAKAQLFALNKLIEFIQEKIFSIKGYHRHAKFAYSFGKLIQDAYINRHRTPAEELKDIIATRTETIKEDQPQVMDYLNQLYALYLIKQNSKVVQQFEFDEHLKFENERRDNESRQEEVRDFYALVNMGKLNQVSIQRLVELFPKESTSEEAISKLCRRIHNMGCEVFDSRNSYDMEEALRSHGLR